MKIKLSNMEKLVLKVKEGRLDFLIDLLKQFDFVEIQQTIVKKKRKKDNYNFFDSAGLWKDRDITAKELRRKAWERSG